MTTSFDIIFVLRAVYKYTYMEYYYNVYRRNVWNLQGIDEIGLSYVYIMDKYFLHFLGLFGCAALDSRIILRPRDFCNFILIQRMLIYTVTIERVTWRETLINFSRCSKTLQVYYTPVHETISTYIHLIKTIRQSQA